VGVASIAGAEFIGVKGFSQSGFTLVVEADDPYHLLPVKNDLVGLLFGLVVKYRRYFINQRTQFTSKREQPSSCKTKFSQTKYDSILLKSSHLTRGINPASRGSEVLLRLWRGKTENILI